MIQLSQLCARPHPEWGPWQGRAPSACLSCLSCPQAACPTESLAQAWPTTPGPQKGRQRGSGAPDTDPSPPLPAPGDWTDPSAVLSPSLEAGVTCISWRPCALLVRV